MPLHTIMLCKRLRVCEWLDHKLQAIHVLFLLQNHKLCVLKIPVANVCRQLRKLILGIPCVRPPEISIVYSLRIQFFSETNSKVLLKLCMNRQVARFWGLGQNAFSGGRDFIYIVCFKKKISGQNKNLGCTKKFGGYCPMATGLCVKPIPSV